METQLIRPDSDRTIVLPGLFIGMGRLGACCFARESFQNWLSLSRSRSLSTYQIDLVSCNLRDLPKFHNIVFACAPKERTESAYREIYITALQNVLKNCCYQRMIFCSSTAVYSENSGGWVDEGSPKEEQNFRGVILLEAESLIRKYAPNNHIILRFSGLCETYHATCVDLSRNHWSNRITRSQAAIWVEKAVQYPAEICQETFSINQLIERTGPNQDSPCTGKRVSIQRAERILRRTIDKKRDL